MTSQCIIFLRTHNNLFHAERKMTPGYIKSMLFISGEYN